MPRPVSKNEKNESLETENVNTGFCRDKDKIQRNKEKDTVKKGRAMDKLFPFKI